MRNFLLTTSDKEIFVEAEWSEQAVEYFKWVNSYDGDVTAREIPCCTAVVDFYCPAGWNVPATAGTEIMRNRHEWLKNYLGKFYEVYASGKETPEFIEFMKIKGWERKFPYFANEMDEEEDMPDVAYINPSHIWGKYPITLTYPITAVNNENI